MGKKNWAKLAVVIVGLFILALSCIKWSRSVGDYPIVYRSQDGQIELIVKGSAYEVNGYEMQKETSLLSTFSASRFVNIWFGLLIISFFLTMYWIHKIDMPPIYKWREWIARGKINNEPLPSLLPSNANADGIICWRTWNVRKGKLASLATDVLWDSCEMESDTLPTDEGWHGVYAKRLGVPLMQRGKVMGLVALSGHCVGHGDEVIRASRCRILSLVAHKKQVDALKTHYKCPVFGVNDVELALAKFLISDDGIYWLKHNNEALTKEASCGS